MIDQARRCGHLFSPQRCTYASAPPPQANAQKQWGASTSSQSSSLTQVVCSHGIGDHKSPSVGKAAGLQGAVSFLKEVSPQLRWRGARRSQAGRANCFGSQKHLHSHIQVVPGFAALPSCWDYTAFSLATCTTSCKLTKKMWGFSYQTPLKKRVDFQYEISHNLAYFHFLHEILWIKTELSAMQHSVPFLSAGLLFLSSVLLCSSFLNISVCSVPPASSLSSPFLCLSYVTLMVPTYPQSKSQILFSLHPWSWNFSPIFNVNFCFPYCNHSG